MRSASPPSLPVITRASCRAARWLSAHGPAADPLKDQSYVLYMLRQHQLKRASLPIGDIGKARCAGHRLEHRFAHRGQARQPGRLFHHRGRRAREVPSANASRCARAHRRYRRRRVGSVPAVELVTVGQRKGLDLAGGGAAPIRRRCRYCRSDGGRRFSRRSEPRQSERVIDVVWTDTPAPADCSCSAALMASHTPPT